MQHCVCGQLLRGAIISLKKHQICLNFKTKNENSEICTEGFAKVLKIVSGSHLKMGKDFRGAISKCLNITNPYFRITLSRNISKYLQFSKNTQIALDYNVIFTTF